MAATNSNFRSSIQGDSFLDSQTSETFHLSNGALDDFDFMIETEGERLFANSDASVGLDMLLRSGGSTMDFQFDSLRDSLNQMSVVGEPAPEAQAQVAAAAKIVPEEEDEERSVDLQDVAPAIAPRSGNYRSARNNFHDSWPGPQTQRFQLNAVNFDPPTERQERRPREEQPRADVDLPLDRRPFSSLSHGDLQAYSSPSGCVTPPPPENKHGEALQLQKLAESMKRTEESRKQVMMQRKMLSLAQQHALVSAKEQLNLEQQVQTQQQRHRHQDQLPSSLPRGAIANAFFSGSRGTLTNGLEQSRKQLQLYMGTVNERTVL